MVSPLAAAIAFQNSVNPAQSGIAPTDVIGAYKLASEVAERNYEAKLKAQMGLWGGLAQLGSAGILGFKPQGGYGPLVSKLFSGATPAGSSDILTGGAALGIPQDAYEAANAANVSGLGASGLGELSDLTVPAADLATPAAGSVAADLAGGAGAAGAADLGGSVAADLGATTAADIGAGAAAEGGADWLLSFLPFLLA